MEAFSPTPMLLAMRHFPEGTEGQSYWYHLDGRGSVAGLTKHQGQSTHNDRYDTYGQLLPAHGNWTDPHNHYTFAGKEWDEHLGLYEFGFRLYDPWAGVWKFLAAYVVMFQWAHNLKRVTVDFLSVWMAPHLSVKLLLCPL